MIIKFRGINESSVSTITPATEADLNSLIRLWTDISHREFAAYIGQANIDFFINSGELAAETAQLLQNTFICKRENRLAGFVVRIDDLIELLIVSPTFQNKRVGKQLYNFAIHKIRQNHLHVKVECFAKNIRVLPTLQHLGFQETGRYFDDTGFETVQFIRH